MEFLTHNEGRLLNEARKILNDLRHRAQERYFADSERSVAWDMGRIEASASLAEEGVFDVLNSISSYVGDSVAEKYAVYVGRPGDE